MNRPLTDQQQHKLAIITKQIEELEMRVWGLLSPSHERDKARIRLNEARFSLYDLMNKEEEK